jgi:hypothetical protein
LAFSEDIVDLVSDEENENKSRENSIGKGNSNHMRWPKVVGLEQIFQDMEIAEQPAFLDIQERRAGTDESVEINNSGK